MDEDFFDSDAAAKATSSMWRSLGEQIAAAIPLVVSDELDPVRAIRWATCAEACFWKATGECDTHDVKDVLTPAHPA
jgi:hypothetical protein